MAGAESPNLGYSGAMSPLRIAGFVLVGMALLFGIANIWYWLIGEGGGVSVYDVWYKFGASSLNAIQGFIQRHVWTGLWNGIFIILIQPAWLVFGVAGIVCIGLGRRKVE